MEFGEEWIGFLPVMVVPLVDVVHEKKLGPVIDGSFHFPGPLLSWNLRLGP
jgi:hypothetical protein